MHGVSRASLAEARERLEALLRDQHGAGPTGPSGPAGATPDTPAATIPSAARTLLHRMRPGHGATDEPDGVDPSAVASAGTGAGAGAGAAQQLSEQLSAVGGLLDREWRLRRSLVDAASPPDARAALLQRLFAGKVGDATLELLTTAVRARWAEPSDLVDALLELATEAGLAAADEAGVLDDVEDGVFRFGRVVLREPRLSLALSDPALPAERKDALLRRLLEGKAQPVTIALLRQAVLDTGGHSLDRRLERISRLAAARRERLVAVVRVARPLDADQAVRLRAALRATYGRDVQLQVDLDPDVLGGVVVTVGEQILDGSVARRIEQVRARLAG